MTTTRVFRGTRVLLQAAKAAITTKPSSSSSPCSSAAAVATAKKKLPTAASTTAVACSKSNTAAPKPKPKPKPENQSRAPPTPNSGIFKLTPVSPVLNKFLGVSQSSRSDVVKRVWDYIKLHNLQNPINKREINCDKKLKTLFEGKDKVEMLEIARILSRHFVKTG